MKEVKYYYSKPVHVRTLPVITDDNGEVIYIMDKVSVKSKKVPRVTVASVYDTDTNRMTFGVAVCSPKDVFEKKIGREIALKRAEESTNAVIVTKRRKIRETSRTHANELIANALSRYVHIDL